MANGEDLDQMQHFMVSYLGLVCLPMPFCPNMLSTHVNTLIGFWKM